MLSSAPARGAGELPPAAVPGLLCRGGCRFLGCSGGSFITSPACEPTLPTAHPATCCKITEVLGRLFFSGDGQIGLGDVPGCHPPQPPALWQPDPPGPCSPPFPTPALTSSEMLPWMRRTMQLRGRCIFQPVPPAFAVSQIWRGFGWVFIFFPFPSLLFKRGTSARGRGCPPL